jgi:hypothetical protein
MLWEAVYCPDAAPVCFGTLTVVVVVVGRCDVWQPRAAWVMEDLEMAEADWQAGPTPETPTVVKEMQLAKLLSERFGRHGDDMSVLWQADQHRAAVYALMHSNGGPEGGERFSAPLPPRVERWDWSSPPVVAVSSYGSGHTGKAPSSADAPLTKTTMSAVHNAATVVGGPREYLKQFTKTYGLNAALVR